MILPRVKQRRSRQSAWALLVVIGKYQVVEDLKTSNEGEKVPRFFCVRNRTFPSGTTQLFINENRRSRMGYNAVRKIMKKTIVLATILCLIAIVGCKKDHYYYIDVRSDNAACSVIGSGTYKEGSSIVISAQPANGYVFKKWNDGNTQDSRYITVWGDATYTAYFEYQNSNISAPTGVTASIFEDEDCVFVYVKWNSVSNAVKYNIYYSQTSNGSYSNIGSVTSNYCYITNPNTHNYVKVTAVNSNGTESNMSNYAYCYYNGGGGGGGTTVPNAPTGVTATNVGTSSSPQIEISWNTVSNATSYKVYRSSSASGTYSLLGSTSSTYKYDNNPMSGYNYYKVKAVNSAGESSYSSYAYYNNTGGGGTTVPNAPTGVTATNVGTSSSPQIEISWNSVSNATSYKVYRSSSASGTYSLLGSTSSTYKYDNNPMSGYNYYKVKAVNSAGESSYSSYAYFNNTGGGGGGSSYEPCPPTVSVSGTSSQTVSWAPATGYGCGTATSYEVYHRDPCNGGTYELMTTTTSTSYHVSSSNVHPGINRYAVRAVNNNGYATNYGYSSSVSLSKPSSFSVQKAGDYLNFEWSMVPKATGYQIYICCTTASGTYTIFDQITDVNTEALLAYYPASSGTTRYFKIRAYFDCDGVGGPIYSDFTTYKVVHF